MARDGQAPGSRASAAARLWKPREDPPSAVAA